MRRTSRSIATRFLWVVFPVWIAAMLFTACGGGADSPTSPSSVPTASTPATPTTSTPSSGSTSTTATITYINDIKPILDSDCVVCHGSRIHENNVRLDTYANVMRVVTPGNANSLIVQETRPGAAMYANLTGDRAAKADLIRAWVVNNNAAESR